MSNNERNPVQQALVDLRAALDVSQMGLAVLLKRSWAAVAKWETSKDPGIEVLDQLQEFAEKMKLPHIAIRFRVAAALRRGFEPLGEGAQELIFQYSILLQNTHLPGISADLISIRELMANALGKLKDAPDRGAFVRGIKASELKFLAKRESDIFRARAAAKKDKQ